jgi:autotransporter-associated beta strand protein
MKRYIVLLLALPLSVQAVLTYNFDDGTLQGWTQVMSGGLINRGDSPTNSQTSGTFRYDVVDNAELLSSGGVNGYLGSGSAQAQSGSYRILPKPFYNRDDNNSTLLLRSPEFYLDGSGNITAYLRGGDSGNAPPATSAGVSATTVGNGFQGVALRRVSDNAYVLYAGRSSNGDDWQLITISQASLTPYVGQTYTLDLIDYSSGGWGWVAMDSVTVNAIQATRWWDGASAGGTGNGASDGGTATWDTSTLNWDQGGALSRVAWVNGNNDTAVFAGTAGTVSLGTGITVGGLQFDTPAYTIQNNTLTIGKTASIVANQNATISSILAGSAAVTKSGTGTLTLSGNNTYSGTMTIDAGTVQAGSATAFNNSGALIMSSGSGTLDLNGNNVRFTASTLSSATATIIDNASGSGTSTAALGTVGASYETSSSLIKDGPTRKVAVTLVNSGAGARFSNGGNTFSGGLTLLNGTRLLPSTIVAGAYGTGPIIIGLATSDSVNIFFQVNNLPFANDIVFNTGRGTDLKGIRFDSSGHVLSGTINANLAPITFSSFFDGGATLSGKLTGSNGLSLASDTGVTTITLNNTATNSDYQGSTLINGRGILVLGASNQIPNGASAGNVTNNGTFRLNGYSDTINGLSGTGIVDGISGTPTLTVGDNNATSSFSGVIKNTAGSLALIKTGSGTLTLSGTNTYTGSTTINAGTLQAGSTGAFNNAGALIMSSGSGTLDLNGNNVRFTASTLSSATATIIDNASGSGTSTAALGTVGAGFVTSSLLIKDGPTRKVSVTLRNDNAGARFSNGGNTFSGGLTLLDSPSLGYGTRLLPSTIVAGAYGSGPIIIGQAATDRAGIFFQVNNLPFTNDIVFNTALGTDLKGIRYDSSGHVLSGTINANLAPITFSSFSDGGATLSGKLTGSNGLSLASDNGTTTITLNNTGANSDYQGTTSINGKGVLALGANNQIPNGASAGNVTNNGTLRLNGFSDTINGLSGTGIVDSVSGTSTLTVGDNNATGASNTFAGVIRNSGGTMSLTKIGSGILTLIGVNTYSGATAVNVGTLLVNGSGVLGSGSAVSVANAATLGGNGTVNGVVSVASGGLLAAGSATGTIGKLTLGSTLSLNGASLNVDINTPGTAGTDYDQIAVSGALTMSGVNTINLNVLSGFIVNGTYTLMSFGTSAASTFVFTNGTTTMIRDGGTLTLVNGTTSLQLTVVGVPTPLTWKGPSGSTVWDTVTANWLNGITPSVFTAGDTVTFDDSAATFTVTGSGAPGSMAFSNNINTYTVSANIAGAGATLRKTGTNTLILSGNNTYSGGSVLLAGTTTVRSATALGTGLIQLGDSSFVKTTLNLDSANMDLQNDWYVQRGYAYGDIYFHQDTQSISGDIDIDMPTFSSFRVGARNEGTDVLSIYGSISARSTSGGISFEAWDFRTDNGGTVRLYGDNSDLRGRLAIDTGSILELYHNNALGSRYPVTVEMGWNHPTLRMGQGVRVGTNAVVAVDQAWPVYLNGTALIGLAPGATSAELAATFSNQIVNVSGGNPIYFSVTNNQTLNLSGNLNGTGNWYVNGNGRVVFSGSGSTGTGRFQNDRGWVEFGHPNALASMVIESMNPPAKYSAAYAGITVANNIVLTVSQANYYTGTNDFTLAGSLLTTAASGTPSLYIDSSASVTFAGDVGVGTYQGSTGLNSPAFYKTGSGNLLFTHTDPEVDSLTLSNASGRIELGVSTLLTLLSGNEIWSYTGGTITGGTLTTKAGGDGRLTLRNYGSSSLVIDSLIRFTNAVNHVQIIDVIASGSGAIKLSNTNNTFSQGQIGGSGVQISSGILETDRIGNHGSPSPLGGSQFPSDGRLFFAPSAGSNAILRYTGPGESANRELFAFGSAPSLHKIEASGSGDLIFNGGYFGALGGATRTWAFGGTGTGRVSASRIIYDPAEVRKMDSGTWVFETQSQNYSGTTLIEAGLLVMNTRYESNGAWSVSSGAILAGNGSIKGALTVNGLLSPGDNGIGTFSVTNNVTWGSTVTPGTATDWRWDLGAGDTADLLNITGDFIKSGSGSFRFNVGGTPPVGTYTLVRWTGSTTFSAVDFSVTGLQVGQSASFAIVGKTLVLTIGNCSGGSPTITLGNNPSTCGSVTRLALSYLSTTLDPNKYTIDYDAAANTAGFVDISAKQPLGIINDNFGSGIVVTNDSRLRENDIDGGWQACQANVGLNRPGSAWKITGGKLQNDATNTLALGYPNYMPGVSPVIQGVTLAGRSGSSISLSFDYSVGAGDTLYVHLRGLTGEFDLDDDFIANQEEGNGLSMSEVANPETDETSSVRKYNFKDGSQTMNGTGAAIAALTGSGTYTTTINVVSLGISGIDDISDFGYVLLAFQKGEDGAAGNTTIDNVVLTSGSLPIAKPGALPNGTYNGTLTVFNSDNCSGSTNFTVTITDSAPSTPGSISGTTRVCAPNTAAYSISQVSGAIGYVWTLPANASLIYMNPTETEIVVEWTSSGDGTISVYAEGGCALAPTSGTRSLTVVADAATPSAPTALAAANITQSGFDARWSALSTAQGFYLDMASLPDFSAASIVVSNEARTGTSRTFTGLAVGSYYYRLRAYNACGTSPNSGIITVTVSEVIANWDTSTQPGGAGNYGASPLTALSYAATYVTVTGLTRQAGVGTAGTGAADGWGGEGWNAVNQAAAEAANDAVTFTIMPNSGVNVNYTTIDVLSYMRQVNGPTDGMLQYALNNGAFVDIGPLTYPSTAVGGATAPEAPIDLSAIAALQNVNVPVTFRIVNWGASDAAADWYIFDQNQSTSPDLQILGTFCLSPTAYAVTGGGVYCLPGGTALSIGLAGSQANVAYQLYLNTGTGPVADGSPVSGTGSALNFGSKTATGTYTVVATRLSGSGCSATMSGSAVVTEATTPAVPTGLTATFDGLDGEIDLAWNAAAGATNYTVSRSTILGGPYTVIANRGATSYSDASVIRNGSTYYYVIASSSSGCSSAYSGEASTTTDIQCPSGVAPTLTAPGNRTVNVGQSVQHAITATDSAISCATPNITSHPSTLPAYITFTDTPSGSSITRTFTIAPSPGDKRRCPAHPGVDMGR